MRLNWDDDDDAAAAIRLHNTSRSIGRREANAHSTWCGSHSPSPHKIAHRSPSAAHTSLHVTCNSNSALMLYGNACCAVLCSPTMHFTCHQQVTTHHILQMYRILSCTLVLYRRVAIHKIPHRFHLVHIRPWFSAIGPNENSLKTNLKKLIRKTNQYFVFICFTMRKNTDSMQLA